MRIKNLKNKIKYSVLDLGVHYNEFIDKRVTKNYYYPIIPSDGFKPHDEPKLYNEYGEQYKVCFISDNGYTFASRYMYFDRYDWGLKTHFYKGNRMLRTVGSPEYRYGITGEPRGIEPWEYDVFSKNPNINDEFDYIFTDDEILLNKYENARFVPISASIFYKQPANDYDDELYLKKTKNVSILASKKCITDAHKIRIAAAKRCQKSGLVDAYGSFSGIFLDDYDEAFTDYRYSIVVENGQSDYYFTEKILSCFAAQVVPIYLGARKIGDFFNEDGIIQIKRGDLEDIPKLVNICSEEDYLSRKEAILDNYNRVWNYSSGWDYMYKKYLIN